MKKTPLIEYKKSSILQQVRMGPQMTQWLAVMARMYYAWKQTAPRSFSGCG